MSFVHLRRLPIRSRLALGYALFLVVTVALVGVFLFTSLESSLEREIDEALRLRGAEIERVIVGDGQRRLNPDTVTLQLTYLMALEEFTDPGTYVQVLDEEGTVVANSPNLLAGQLPATTAMVTRALGGTASYLNAATGRDRLRLLAWPVESADQVIGVVLVGESLHLRDVALQRVRSLLAVATLAAALAATIGGWWLTGRALGPVASVTRVARRIAATGQFEQRIVPPPARDELGDMVATFNDMLSRLEKTFRRQQEFLADASHELRGPLMIIRGNLDLLKLHLPEEDRVEGAQEAIEEVERMSRLVSNLLFLAEVDAQEESQHQPVQLQELVTDAWEQATMLDGCRHHVDLARNDAALVLGDPDRLAQLLRNLVTNALRYTPAGGRVTVSLRNHGSIAELVVADTGIGIEPERLPRIFERFYRVDSARSRSQGGSGLGLAIVKQVAEAHGGQVRVRSNPGEGSVFTVVLPVLQP